MRRLCADDAIPLGQQKHEGATGVKVFLPPKKELVLKVLIYTVASRNLKLMKMRAIVDAGLGLLPSRVCRLPGMDIILKG